MTALPSLQRSRGFTVNIGEVLGFVALGALVLNPLLATLAAALFLLFGILLIVSQPRHSANADRITW